MGLLNSENCSFLGLSPLRQIQDLGRGFITGSSGLKAFTGVQGQNPRKKSGGVCPPEADDLLFKIILQ